MDFFLGLRISSNPQLRFKPLQHSKLIALQNFGASQYGYVFVGSPSRDGRISCSDPHLSRASNLDFWNQRSSSCCRTHPSPSSLDQNWAFLRKYIMKYISILVIEFGSQGCQEMNEWARIIPIIMHERTRHLETEKVCMPWELAHNHKYSTILDSGPSMILEDVSPPLQ